MQRPSRPLALALAAPLLLLLLVGACHSAPKVVQPEREANLEAVEKSEPQFEELGERYLVIQNGELVAASTLADDAVRAAEQANPRPKHRFVFRPDDRKAPLQRMVFVPEGGVVVGTQFLESLGMSVGPYVQGQPIQLTYRGSRREIDLGETPTLPLIVETLDGERRVELAAVLDPEFNGGLLVPVSVAGQLDAHLFEVPGSVEVQVAIGRPFTARRALVHVELPTLQVSGPAPLLYEQVRGMEKP